MLQIQSARKIFHKRSALETKALDEVSLTIDKGDFQVIVGANGSGKSTLLNAIAGNVILDSGKIILNNKEIQSLPEYKRSPWIARVFQDPLAGTASELSVLDNFRLASLRCHSKKLTIGTGDSFKKLIQEKIASLQMGLEDKLDQSMGSLSGGQRQALTLLMSVLSDLDILLLDEPTAALDPKSAKSVMEIANNLINHHQITAVLITHNIQEALIYGNKLLHMEEGRIKHAVHSIEKQNLKQQEILEWFDYI